MTSHPTKLSDNELECVTAAFRSLETGVRRVLVKLCIDKDILILCRGATIDQDSIQAAMLMLGLNPSDQECVDIPNEFARLNQI